MEDRGCVSGRVRARSWKLREERFRLCSSGGNPASRRRRLVGVDERQEVIERQAARWRVWSGRREVGVVKGNHAAEA